MHLAHVAGDKPMKLNQRKPLALMKWPRWIGPGHDKFHERRYVGQRLLIVSSIPIATGPSGKNLSTMMDSKRATTGGGSSGYG